MKITLESTDRIVTVSRKTDKANAIEARVWEGHTEKGIKVYALVAMVAHPGNDDAAEFEAELREVPHRPADTQGPWPLRYFLD